MASSVFTGLLVSRRWFVVRVRGLRFFCLRFDFSALGTRIAFCIHILVSARADFVMAKRLQLQSAVALLYLGLEIELMMCTHICQQKCLGLGSEVISESKKYIYTLMREGASVDEASHWN